MTGNFRINRQGIARIALDVQREFDKHPIRLPLEADADGVALPASPGATNYYGPVVQVNGGHAQLAWDNQTVNQNQSNTQEIAPGYEALAEALVRTLQSTEALGLAEADRVQLEASVKEVLSEVTRPEPEATLIERGVNVVKGLLANVALGMATGVTEESKQLAVHVIEEITHAL